MHVVHSTLFMGHSQRYIRQTTAETIVRTQTNATKISLARRKDAQALLVDGQPASGSHDKRTSPTNPQPPTAPAICSGGNNLSLRCCRCSPSRHATGIQKQNLTDEEKASSRHSRSEKGQISSKHAGEIKNFSGENLPKDLPNTLTATRSCTLHSLFAQKILTADQVDHLPTRFLDTYPMYHDVQRGRSSS